MPKKKEIVFGKIDVPLPFPPRVVHVHLLKVNDNVILVDLGPNAPTTKEALVNGLKKFELALEDITHVIFTHSHVDHAGFAAPFRELNPEARMYIHEKELEYYNDRRHQRLEKLAELFEAMDPSIRSVFLEMERYYNKMKTPIEPTDLILGTRFALEIDDLKLELQHVPGHTPGSIVIYLPTERILYTGDSVLAHISPIISYSDFEYDGLGMYVNSLRKMQSLKVKEAWPSHGARIKDFNQRLRELLQHHDKRLREVYKVVRKMKRPVWPLDLVSELFEESLPVNQYPLAFFEVLAHFIHLQRLGKLEHVPKEGWQISQEA